MSRRLKIFLGISFSLLVIGFLLYSTLQSLVTKSFPIYEGEMTLHGLQFPVSVYRDEFAIPHVVAQNNHDAFFMQGYIHAQERLWQMDISRRAGEGRLSEILGVKTLPFDRMLRTIGFSRIADSLLSHISSESRSILEAYAEGVNAYIALQKGRYPIEFDMLNYEPEKWRPVHSLMIARLMGWELNISWHVDIVLGELVNTLGIEKAQYVFPTYPENAPVIVPGKLTGESLSALRSLLTLDNSRREYFGWSGMHIGSNSWAIGPQKSLSGKAMLANDPHLGLGTPAKWFEMHLTSDSINVSGMSLPGTPLIVIGHNADIAWGLTNVMADDADFYVEKFDTSKMQYEWNGSWRKLIMYSDTIIVKDSSSVPITILSTHHGPIINSIYPLETMSQGNFISLRWTGFEFSDELQAIYKINTANNWKTFRDGVRLFSVPGQNFVYADRNGNIGYKSGVKLPIRSTQNPTLPFDGSNNSHEWKGFVPFDQLPETFNPPTGYIATANNKSVENFPYHISNLWEPPSRIQRIVERISSTDKLGTQEFKELQNDLFSHFAQDVTPYILSAFDTTQVSDTRIATALVYFKNWNFILTKDDVPTAIFETFFQALIKNTFQDEMGNELFEQYIVLANMPYRVMTSLLNSKDNPWFDDIHTEQSIENRDDMIRKSLLDAVNYLEQEVGSEMKEWRWGRLHTITFKHLFGDVKVLQSIFNIGPFAIGGSGTTVNNGEYKFRAPYGMTLGPSMRMIVDFSDIDRTLTVLPTGQSGQPLHDHYSDQVQLWLHGEYHEVPFSLSAVKSSAVTTFIYTPEK